MRVIESMRTYYFASRSVAFNDLVSVGTDDAGRHVLVTAHGREITVPPGWLWMEVDRQTEGEAVQ